MRQIVFDTETTGLLPEAGHRIIEIGGVELVDRQFTGNNFQCYINPQREVEDGALKIHGLSTAFLADKPLFSEIVDSLLSYIEGAELIIHNAPFDVGFLDYEFKLLNKGLLQLIDYASVMDTLALARKKHPGKKNNLDALCKRYRVDNSGRELHGALLDAQLLAEVYLAMTGGQMSLFDGDEDDAAIRKIAKKSLDAERSTLQVIRASSEELELHQERLKAIADAAEAGCLWQD